jgi:hypothetical protein
MKTQPQTEVPPDGPVGTHKLSSDVNAAKGPVATALGSDKTTTDADDLARLRDENEKLKATIRNAAAHRQITGELGRIGARSPELLFEYVKGDLQFTDDDAVVNAAAIVDKLRRQFPEQFGTQTVAGIDAAAGQVQPPRLSKESLGRMTTAEIAQLDWNDVKRVLAS